MALDQIVVDNPGRVASMEWHLRSGYPMYLYEASQKMRFYPPPRNGLYYTPWLWADGVNRGSGYTGWAGYVEQALAVPAEVGISISGGYDPGSRAGEAIVEFANTTAEPITATAVFVITEDSIYYQAPNGDLWHNHVCRDFVPDQYGTTVTVPAEGVDTLPVPYAIDPVWDDSRCKLVVFLQTTDVQPDSSRPVYQGAELPVLELTALAEGGRTPAVGQDAGMTVVPNPLVGRAELRFQSTPGERYRLDIFGPDGRLVRHFDGTATGQEARVSWDRTDGSGKRVARGVYTFRLRTGRSPISGRVVVTTD